MNKKQSLELTELFDLASSLNSPNRLRDLLALAKLLISLDRQGEAEQVIVVAKELAKTKTDFVSLATCLLLEGECALVEENYDKAFVRFCRALELSKAKNLGLLRIESHFRLAKHYEAKFEFELLIRECQIALTHLKAIDSKFYELEFREWLWQYQSQFDKENALLLIDSFIQSGQFVLAARVKQSLADSLITDFHFSLAVSYLEEVYCLHKLNKNSMLAKETELQIGKLLYDLGRLEDAAHWLGKSSRKTPSQYFLPLAVEAEVYLRLVEVKMGKRLAKQKLTESIAMARCLALYELIDGIPEIG